MLNVCCSGMPRAAGASRLRHKACGDVAACLAALFSSYGGLFCCRACQTVLAALAARLLPALAPVLPHMAEDAWQHLPWPQPAASVFQVSAPAVAEHIQQARTGSSTAICLSG